MQFFCGKIASASRQEFAPRPMARYRFIRELVISACLEEGGFPSREKLEALVKEHFPTSRWNDTQYAYYKSQITNGRIYVEGVSEPRGDADDPTGDEDGAVDATISLERDLHAYFQVRVGELEAGIRLVPNGLEYPTDAGRIDPLARDVN